MNDVTFLVQQRLIDGSWYQTFESSFLLTAVSWRDKCAAAHPDRIYRLAQREVVITTLDI